MLLKDSSRDALPAKLFLFASPFVWSFSVAVAAAAVTAFHEAVAGTSRYQACAVIVNSRHYRNLKKSYIRAYNFQTIYNLITSY